MKIELQVERLYKVVGVRIIEGPDPVLKRKPSQVPTSLFVDVNTVTAPVRSVLMRSSRKLFFLLFLHFNFGLKKYYNLQKYYCLVFPKTLLYESFLYYSH